MTGLDPANPFAAPSTLPYGVPDFAAIRTEHYEPAVRAGLAEGRERIRAVREDASEPTVENTLVPLQEFGSPLLARTLSVFFNVVSSVATDELRELEAVFAPLLAQYEDEIGLDPVLAARVQRLSDRIDAGEVQADADTRYLAQRELMSFRLAGALLDDASRTELAGINNELANLTTRFGKQLMESMAAATVVVTDASDLTGLTEEQVSAARTAATERGHDGAFAFPPLLPSVQPVLASLENRALRELIFAASIGRGAENRADAARIAHLRARKARLLGFENYAALAVTDRTAHTPEAVEGLLARIVPPTMRNLESERTAIAEAAAADGIEELQPWDWPFYEERIRRERYAVDTAALRPYFPLDQVIEKGVFEAAHRLYGVSFTPRTDLVGYHPDVRVWEVHDADGSGLGLFLGDYYAREGKNGGAWMNSFSDRSDATGARPVIVNNLNFSRPAPGETALLTFDETRSLFHEFGHALHGLLAHTYWPDQAGTRVPRDIVEYPSQVNEMWAFDPDIVASYARHVETGEVLPAAELERIKAADMWGEAFATCEFMQAVLLDWAWHTIGADEAVADPVAFESAALAHAGIAHPLVAPRYRTGYFQHVFSGGYAAGYYGYIWAEAYDADTVEWFRDHGGLTRENGDAFRAAVLSRGGSRDVLDGYRELRGRAVDVTPLLRRRGLA